MEQENNTQNNSFKQKILEKIETGEVKMRSKTFFFLRVSFLVVLAVMVFVLSVLLVSYILFSLKAAGHLYLLGFGFRGFYEFLLVFPWFVLIIDILLLVFFDWLVKRWKLGYHSPIIYLFSGSVVLIVLLGSIVDRTSFHQSMMYRAENRNLPMMSSFYNGLRKSHREYGIFRGFVTAIDMNTFTIKHSDYDIDSDDGLSRVVMPTNFDVRAILQVGDQVFIAGDVVNGEIRAYGIRKLNPDE